MFKPYSDRKYVIGIIIFMVFIIYVWRLYSIQILDVSYRLSANNNVLRYVTQFPARGMIFDRNGELLVYNEPAYDLMVIPKQVGRVDTSTFCKILGVSEEFFLERMEKVSEIPTVPSVFLKQISQKKCAMFQEMLYKFPGFYFQTRTLRKYPQKIAAHLLGYVGEISENSLRKNQYYQMGDYIGINGIEKAYEKVLRGNKGVKVFLVDVKNRIKGNYEDGQFDTSAIVGAKITTTIDSKLQKYGEMLMTKKIGSIVAIEPATGEVLALVSSPGYDPNLMAGRARSRNYFILQKDSLNPLFNRALMAKYPPGSTFKMVNALIGMQEKVITSQSVFACSGGYHVGSFSLGCHHSGLINLLGSIQSSCNAYYCNVFRRILDDRKFGAVSLAYANWRRHLLVWGIGKRLGSDLGDELRGYVPTVDYYDRFYGKNHWKSLMLISMAIGQGELGLTPLQLANMTAIIANKGFYYIPHIIKEIGDKDTINSKFRKRHNTLIDPKYFGEIIDGMELVVRSGTATSAWVNGIDICGKTGTAQNPHGEAHSIFVAFAPKENPEIAISVYIENGGSGGTWAAPVASLMIEKYLRDSISRPGLENFITNADIINGIIDYSLRTVPSENNQFLPDSAAINNETNQQIP